MIFTGFASGVFFPGLEEPGCTPPPADDFPLFFFFLPTPWPARWSAPDPRTSSLRRLGVLLIADSDDTKDREGDDGGRGVTDEEDRSGKRF